MFGSPCLKPNRKTRHVKKVKKKKNNVNTRAKDKSLLRIHKIEKVKG